MHIKKLGFEETEKRNKIDLKIEIKNFGPISSGELFLKPLTIFIGPNNSGKSYAAMLINSIFESYISNTIQTSMTFSRHGAFISEYFDLKDFFKQVPELKKQIEGLKLGEELEISKNFIEKITNNIFDRIYKKRMNDEIIRSYACPLNDLIKHRENSFEMKISFNSFVSHLIYQNKKLEFKQFPRPDSEIKIKLVRRQGSLFNVNRNGKEIFIEMGGLAKIKDQKKFIFSKLLAIIFDSCISNFLEKLSIPCYYLPAARSGILQGHKALVANIVKKTPFVGIKRLELPIFSGVISDFISSILTLSDRKGSFYKLAQDFESEMISGEIIVPKFKEYLYPEIRYKFNNTDIPLHRTSSTVSELAPLILYLKYSIEPGSILIIEEPEAHLHPQNQRILAKYLVKLIRTGVNVVITTHSEFLLEQLSSFIMLSKVEPEKRMKKYNYSHEYFLEPEEVAAHVFNYDESCLGFKINEVEITEDEGISQEEFLKIHESLYDETIKLRQDVLSQVVN